MKRFFEFEVIIPDVVFDHVTENSLIELLSCFNVKFERKGFTDFQTEYFVSASSRDVANSVRDLLSSLQRVFRASSFTCSCLDKSCCPGWLFGIIREVVSDEIDASDLID